MIRRLFNSGNSVVLSMPKEYLESLGVAVGDELTLQLDHVRKRLILAPMEKEIEKAGIDEAFASQVAEFIDRYRPALQELAK